MLFLIKSLNILKDYKKFIIVAIKLHILLNNIRFWVIYYRYY